MLVEMLTEMANHAIQKGAITSFESLDNDCFRIVAEGQTHELSTEDALTFVENRVLAC
ncbi:MAG: hypothetical protein HC926_00385 [Synechococcaceae cyanobacterium SM2_3_60]|nr:hypothetical protein [Synechococcaceae cyanobacterium SM2_3_60]